MAEPKTYHYEYDRQGNTLSDGENTYRYDSLNRIVEVRTKNGDIQKNRYDGEGLRAELEENGRLVAFIFDGDKVVSEKTDNNTIRYIRGYELISSDSEKAKTYYHYASDELGSTTHLTDENGNVYNYYEYDAFGNFLTKAENVPNRFCFTGEQYDPLTSQYYLRARFYNPAIGRFLNEDTYYGDGLNLYAYCHNNPVKYVDPSGHDACPLAVQKYKEKGYSDEYAVIMANYDKLREEQGVDAAERYLQEQAKSSKSGSNTIDNRLVNHLSFDNGERIATTSQIRNYKKQMQSMGINVVVDKKGKVLTGDKEAGFDYATGTIYIKKKSGVIGLYHEGFHAEQYLNIGKENYVSLGTLAREEYVYSRIMDNSTNNSLGSHEYRQFRQ